MRKTLHKLTACFLLAHAAGVVITRFHRETARQFCKSVRDIWAI